MRDRLAAEVALLRRVGFLSALGPRALEQLAVAARRQALRRGEALGEASDVLEADRSRPLPARVREALSRLGAGRREVQVTHEGLAALVGASREAVSRALKAVEREGAVALRRGRIELP